MTGCLPTAGSGAEHLRQLRESLDAFAPHAETVDRWGRHLAGVLRRRGRLLAAGNGGSAAEAQHLTAELVGRYVDEREPLSALSLHAETSSLTAILNDYGPDEVYARQVRAHGRPGDVLVLLSTSGRSRNVVAAAEAGRRAGLAVWAMTGPGPNDLSRAADEAVCVDAPSTATVQELHLVAVHMLAGAVDVALGVSPRATAQVVDLSALTEEQTAEGVPA